MKTPCTKCKQYTRSIRKGRASYYCEGCGKDKSLSDAFYYDLQNIPVENLKLPREIEEKIENDRRN
jgi:hypothetical protein